MRINNLRKVRGVLGAYRKWSQTMSVREVIRKAARRGKDPVWAGPCGEGPQGGITQGLISRYLSCKERFRISVIEGLKPNEGFNSRLEFGNLWHACEEALAGEQDWKTKLIECETALGMRYPLQRQEIAEWAGKTLHLFPRYVQFWSEHPDVKDRTPLEQEAAFDVPYKLPSGRIVRLRGKRDSTDVVNKSGVWLQENKTKGTIDSSKILRQLTFDLQTMLYLVALRVEYDKMGWAKHGPLMGVRYNVIRRSMHKSVDGMLKKLDEDQRNGRIGEWFARWKVEISPEDIARFKRECLDPVLENVCDDYEWWAYCKRQNRSPFEYEWRQGCGSFHSHRARHFRMPYRGYDPLAEGAFGDVDEYMATNSEAGMRRVDDLFPELKV